MNDDSDFLLLSGLSHFRYCRRQWALIHIEQQWAENSLTQEGHYLHERVHDADFTEKRGSILLSRGMPVRSERLRVTGACDMVEMTQDESGVPIQGREGRWRLYPVEYKRGKPEAKNSAAWQLCAEALCLEEMFVTEIPEGAIYSAEQHRRHIVSFTQELRSSVTEALETMHRLYERGETPKGKLTSACKSCSMRDICRPDLGKRISVKDYMDKMMAEQD